MSCSAILADETAKPDTTFKDQLLLRTYPGTERSSLPTAGMHDHIQIFRDRSTNALIALRSGIIRICFLFTMSWNPQETCVQACGRATLNLERNLLYGQKQRASVINRKLPGGA